MADTKVTAFTNLPSPVPANSYVPVVVTGDATNYKAPWSGGDVGTEFTVADNGQFVINGLSTNDPSVENAIWSDNGVLVQSGHTAPSGGGGYVPVPGSPTKFIRQAFTHPGNEDGTGTRVDFNLGIADGEAWFITAQFSATIAGNATSLIYAMLPLSTDYNETVLRVGGVLKSIAGLNTMTPGLHFEGVFLSDSMANMDLLNVNEASDGLYTTFYGLGEATASHWVFELQATPIVLTTRPTTATGL